MRSRHSRPLAVDRYIAEYEARGVTYQICAATTYDLARFKAHRHYVRNGEQWWTRVVSVRTGHVFQQFPAAIQPKTFAAGGQQQ